MKNNKPIYLVITPFFPSEESFRGPYIYDQVKAIMATDKYQVVVLMPATYPQKPKDYVYDGITVHRFHIFELPTAAYPGLFDRINLTKFDTCLKRLGIDYKDIAVVHSHVTQNGIFANKVKKENPKVITVLQHHGYDVLGLTNGRFSKYGWHKKRVISYGTKICNEIDLHIGVSQKTLDYLAGFNGIHIKKSYVLYNGVDLTKFHKKDTPRTDKKFHIGCIANFWEIKDQITLLKALKILVDEGERDIKVSFIGTGPTRLQCEEYVQENGLAQYVEFRNEVDHRQLNNFYNTLDLFALPSYWDAFGCVYTEAYACGVPFVSAYGSGIVELLDEKQQKEWVIQPKDYGQLATIIKRIIIKKIGGEILVDELQPLKHRVDINYLLNEYLRVLDK